MAVVYKEQADPNSTDPASSFTDERSYEVCKFFSEIIKGLPAKCWVAGGAIVSAFIGAEKETALNASRRHTPGVAGMFLYDPDL